MNKTTNYILIPTERRLAGLAIAAGLVMLFSAPAAGLTRIQDIARPLGERTNQLIGMGLVVGLAGTGDSADSRLTNRPLASLLQNLGGAVSAEELRGKNVAFVSVTVTLGRNGVRKGDAVDAYVASVGDASSLAGGRLLWSPLQSLSRNNDSTLAWARGLVVLPDAEYPTTGVVKGGAVLEIDFLHEYVEYDENGNASFTLVLEEDLASFQVARTVAIIIDEEIRPPGDMMADAQGISSGFARIAEVLGPRNVKVHIGAKQAQDRNASSLFIARVLDLQIDLPDPEATVVVNPRTGVIIVTGNVEISPIAISLPNLVIIVPEAGRLAPARPFIETQWGKFDTTDVGGSKLNDLLQALDQLKVPAQEKINALYQIQRVGALRARLVTE